MCELRRVGALVIGALLTACASSDHLYLLKREVTCSAFGGSVEFLPEAPGRPHVEVARIEATGAIFVPTTWENLRFYLCRQALAVEADGVVGLEQGHIDYSVGFTPLSLDWTNKKLTGVAIRYLEPGERAEDVEAPPAHEDGEPAHEDDEPAHEDDEPAVEPGASATEP